MSSYVAAMRAFFCEPDAALGRSDLHACLDTLLGSERFGTFLEHVVDAPVFSREFGRGLAAADAADAIAPCRMLRGSLNLPLQHFFALVAQVADAFDIEGDAWRRFADRMHASVEFSDVRLADYLVSRLPDAALRERYRAYVDRLIEEHPHAVYPTSNYRECDGFVEATADHRSVEAVMSVRTFSSIRIVDHVLEPERHELRDIYRPLGRCICIIDTNVHALYGERLERYFRVHGIELELLPYRATEADKGLATVERMLGDFKRLGVSRNEPVLIAGGGVLADTGGLACALYGRSTPYVMLATSIVSGIDAGPSPRTCCDGFGYKNLLGAYHPPSVCLTDRFFFGTLHEGWLRHGVAEIVKIALVTSAGLVEDLERAQPNLVATRFGTIGCAETDEIGVLSQKILSGAMRAYVEAEYDNLYETHQCRPHAYGHTWSPGFEIEAGLLHGHAVAIDMGYGAYVSLREGWIDRAQFERILALISGYGLSLWHDVLADEAIMWESHRKIVQKRGGNLVAPLPKGAIGRCGYLNELSRDAFFSTLHGYREICAAYPREGRGIDALCSDVGLEDPSVAGRELSAGGAIGRLP